MDRAAVSEAADLAFEPPRRYQIFDNSIFSGVCREEGFPPVFEEQVYVSSILTTPTILR